MLRFTRNSKVKNGKLLEMRTPFRTKDLADKLLGKQESVNIVTLIQIVYQDEDRLLIACGMNCAGVEK